MNLTAEHLQQAWQLLWGELAQTRHYLEQHIARINKTQVSVETSPAPTPGAATLDHFCQTFGLSDFERHLLLLCVGMELDKSLASLCAEAQGDTQKPYPTFDLALAALPHPHWSALTPHSPLRQWRLIDVGVGQTLTLSPLRVDEWVLHYLIGTACCDDRLSGFIQPITDAPPLVPSHQHLATQIANLWSRSSAHYPMIQLYGQDGSKQAIAIAACHQMGWQLYELSALVLPTQAADLNTLIVLWEREAALKSVALLVNCDALDLENHSPRQEVFTRLVERFQCPLLMTSLERWRPQQRSLISLPVHQPTTREQYEIWQQELGNVAPLLNGHIEALTTEFNLTRATIRAICAEVMEGSDRLQTSLPQHSEPEQIEHLNRTLRQTCRAYNRPKLDDLAQRIDAIATWDDLVLPEKEKQILETISAHVSHRTQVYDRWGFRSSSSRGLGISALFAGSSGTGKTMSAEVLAHHLQLDLYRIDLSSVVSKYIGETEKNLKRIFDAAEASAVILLFDEADALFGKRSEVKDSHDRYANMEVSYLLQRMESYQGLAILTTNLKDSLDTAFLRRIRFVVKFPFPDLAQRTEIWKRVFPPQTPTQDLDFQKLAKLNVSGGNIRNIALNATFLAAHAGEPVQMYHIRTAAESEYMKLERTLTDAEVKGWL